LPLVVMLFLWLTGEWLVYHKRWAGGGALLLPLLGVQLNFSAVILWPVLFVMAYWKLWRPAWSTWRVMLLMALSGWFGLVLGKWWWSELTAVSFLWSSWLALTLP